MITIHKILLTVFVLWAIGWTNADKVSAQPTVSITTDKSQYEQFEFITVNFTIKNTTGKRQTWGPASMAAFDDVVWILEGPSGERIGTHRVFNYRDGPGPILPVTYESGDSLSGVGYPLFYWPVWDVTGTYTLKAAFGGGYWSTNTIATTTFDVVAPAGVDSAVLDLLADLATNWTYAIDAFRPGVDPTEWDNRIDSVASLPGLPPHVTEFARYLHAFYADVAASRFGQRDTTDLSQRYAAFLADYPNSPFRTAVEQRYYTLAEFRGGPSFYDGLDISHALDVKVFLEGAYNSALGEMSTTMSSSQVIPLAEPIPPWNHTSYPRLSAPDYSQTETDWIRLMLVDSLGAKVDSSAASLDNTGLAGARFLNLPPGQYRVIVDHRNHLAVASDTLLDFTTGYAEHDFTTGHALGVAAQKLVATSPDSTYAMWAGDANVDCQITATDFNAWLADTKAVRTGYLQTDFNMDVQVTVGDFNLWLQNTKAVATSRGVACLTGNGLSLAPYTGPPAGEAAQKTSIASQVKVTYRITGNAANGYLNARIAAKTSPPKTDTLGSFTFDVYYNSDQLFYGFLMNTQGLLDAGFVLNADKRSNEHGAFVRVQGYWPDSTYIIGSEYKLLRLRFWELNGPITSHDIAFNLFSLSVSALNDGKFEEYEQIVPIYDDVYSY